MNASIEIQNGVKTLSSAPADAKYYNNSGAPYTNVAEVNSQIPSALRGRGLTVNVAGVEYWYKDGILDDNLVVKVTGGGETHTHANKAALDKIGESAGNPTWNGGAWPGGGGAAPTADNVNTALQGFTEGTPTGDSYLPFIGKVKAKLSAVTTVIGSLLANTFAAKTHGHAYSEITSTPTIPAAQIQSDWTQTNNQSLDFIKNKPTIPAAQVNSDWDATSGLAQILNKPTIPAAYTHPTGDGNQHIPVTSTTSNGKVLTAGATAGSAAWEAPAIGDAHGFVAPPQTGNFSVTGTAPNITFSLLSNAGDFKINGAKFTARQMDLSTTLVLGQNFIYCALNNGVPTLYKTTGNASWTITDLTAIPVATLNWDGTNVRVSDELHLASRNLIQHQKEHDTDGARYVSGFFTKFEAAAANTFSAATGKIRDEERYHEIAAKTQAQIAYRNAAGTAMIFDAPGTAFVKLGGTGSARPLYDNGSGTPVELGSSQYGIMWMYATNGKLPANSEIVFVMGQGTYATVAAAQAANQPTLSGMAVAEWKLLYRVIIRQSAQNALVYTQADDFRLSTSGPAQNAGAASVVSAAGVTVSPIATLPETNVQAALERLSQYQGAFAEEYVTVAAGSGNAITLKKDTLTAIANVLDSTVTGLTVSFPTPVAGSLNQSILYFKIGASLPTGLSLLDGFTPLSTPIFSTNSTWQFIYTQVRVGTSTWNKLVAFTKLA